MKNYKFIPLLAVLAFMTACNTNGASSSKSVSFAKQGKEVEYQEFKEAINDPILLGAFSNLSDNHIPSSVVKMTGYSESNSKLTSKKKVVASSSAKSSGTVTVKFDMNNLRISTKFDSTYSVNESNESGKSSMKAVEKEDTVYQISNVILDEEEAKPYFVEVDNITKTYIPRNNMVDANAIEKRAALENTALDIINDFSILPEDLEDMLANYENSSVAMQANYKFFLNEKVFTVEFHNEYTRANINENNLVNYASTYVIDTKYQLDATKGESFKFVTLEKEAVTTEYRRSFVIDSGMGNTIARFIGDVEKEVSAYGRESEVKVQDVTVKEVDTAKYRAGLSL